MEQNIQTKVTLPERTDWKTKVRCWQPVASDGSVNTDPIQEVPDVLIPEEDPCVTMPGFTPGPLGRPIDADVAVTFISEFYKEATAAFGPESDEDVKAMEYDELLNAFFDARSYIKQLKNLDYGMTIDKNFALKLLSQPKCEGLRGYLCYKDENPRYPFSLVTVGVDENGFDLRYDKTGVVQYQQTGIPATQQPVIKASAYAAAVDHVNMQSLTGEYITPPYTVIDARLEERSRFILLDVARGQKI